LVFQTVVLGLGFEISILEDFEDFGRCWENVNINHFPFRMDVDLE
jgi:hypothetical protein